MVVITRSKSRKNRRRKISDSRAERVERVERAGLDCDELDRILECDERYDDLLYCVSYDCDILSVDFLIKRGVDVNKVTKHSDGGTSTSLYAAAQEGHLIVVTKLIAAGADVDAATNDGATPLFIAAENDHNDVVTKLIASGADVNMARTTDGSTPLYMAASKCNVAIVANLLQHGADKSIRGWKNRTPLEQVHANNRFFDERACARAAIIGLLTP